MLHRNRVDLMEKASQARGPGGLPVQNVYIASLALVVPPEESATVTEDCAVREQGSVDGESTRTGSFEQMWRVGARPWETKSQKTPTLPGGVGPLDGGSGRRFRREGRTDSTTARRQ